MPASPTSSHPRGQPHPYSFFSGERVRHLRWTSIVVFAITILFLGSGERSVLMREDGDATAAAAGGKPAYKTLSTEAKAGGMRGRKTEEDNKEGSGGGRSSAFLDPTIMSAVFKRHCDWEAPKELLESLAEMNYSVPALVKASMEYCPKSALPYASIDVWYHQADVRIVGGSVEEASLALQQACNDDSREEACIIFIQTELIRTSLGAPLLMRVVQQPFIVISAGNDDECIPFKVVPRADEENATPSDIDDLIHSPLLIRWYAKNMCIHPGHTGGKLLPLPLGPKWQWHSHSYDGEDKLPIKSHMVAAGGHDPRALYMNGKERQIYIAMDEGSTDGPYYHPNRDLRRQIVQQVAQAGFPTSPSSGSKAGGGGGFHVAKVGPVSHEEYMKTLAKSAFALSPPGRGLDTHRTWEALSFGTIPIVMRNSLDPVYRHLPVMVIGDISELTPARVEAFYQESRAASGGYDWHRVTAFYWLQFLVRDARRKREVMEVVMEGVFDRRR